MQRLTAGIAAMREGYSSATVTRPWVAHLPYIAVLIVLVLLAGAPLLRLQAFSGHDATEYLPRNVEFYRGLQDGQLLPRWAPDLSGGHGQPLFNFNPPVIYYATALFHALGAGFSAAESLACLALLLLAAIGMYVFGQSLFGRPAGLISGTAYIFAPYFLLVLYVRHALADFAIFAFMPFAFWGLYRYISTARPRYLAVGAGAVGLMSLSSNPVALITMPALLALPLWFAWIRRDRRIARSMVLRGAWCLTLGMGLSAFFWLPALAERDYVHIQRLLESFLNYQNHFVSFQQLIYSPWGYGLSVLGTEDGMSFAIGTIHLVLIVVAAGLWWQQRRAASATKAMLGFMLEFLAYAVFMSLDASQFVWDRLSLLQYLEYPWRFHSLVAFSSAVLCGAVLHGLSVYRPALTGRASIALVVGLLLFNLALAKPEQYPTIDESWYSPVNIAASYIDVNTANEYDPVWVQTRPSESVKTPLTFLQGTGRLRETTLAPITRRYEIELTSKARLRENTFYFPGWKLYVDGAEQTIDYSNQYGLMDFELGPGRHSIRFEFVNTPVRTWGWWVTIFTLLLVIIFVGFNTFKRLVVRWIKGSNTPLRQPLAQR